MGRARLTFSVSVACRAGSFIFMVDETRISERQPFQLCVNYVRQFTR